MNTPNTPTANKGGRPRKSGHIHKWIVPERIEELAKTHGIDYIWTAALQWHRLMNSTDQH